MASAQLVDETFLVMSSDSARPITSYKIYRGAGLMEINKTLYKIICFVGHNGPYEFADNPSMILKLKAIHRSCRVDIYYVGNRKGTVYVMKYMPLFKTCDQCLGIVQRSARRWLDRRRSERALSVAMALHARLGVRSTIHCVQEDILRLVCSYL